MYESSDLGSKHLWQYGLEESDYPLWRMGKRIEGKKLIWFHAQALQHVFGVATYQSLWQVDGVLERKARQVDRTSRMNAVTYFRASLNERVDRAHGGGGSDLGHQQMIEEMRQCMKRIEAIDKSQRPHKGPGNVKKNPVASAGGNAYAAPLDADEEDAGESVGINTHMPLI